MTTRLQNLEVQEVSLVDDPAVPKARYLITKRASSNPTTNVTDTTEAAKADEPTLIERIGKSVWDMLGGEPADESTRRLIASNIAKAAEADEAEEEAEKANEADAEPAEAEESAEKGAKKCPTCGRFGSGGQRHADADKKDKAESAEAADEAAEEQEAEKADEAAEESEEEAEKAAAEESDEDPNAALLESFKSLLDTELAPIREAVGKSVDAAQAIGERVEALEKRKGVSKAAKGAELESDDGGESMFGNVIFGG